MNKHVLQYTDYVVADSAIHAVNQNSIPRVDSLFRVTAVSAVPEKLHAMWVVTARLDPIESTSLGEKLATLTAALTKIANTYDLGDNDASRQARRTAQEALTSVGESY